MSLLAQSLDRGMRALGLGDGGGERAVEGRQDGRPQEKAPLRGISVGEDLLDDVPLLIDFDGIDAGVATAVLELADGVLEGGVGEQFDVTVRPK